MKNESMKTSYRNFTQQLIGVFLEITLEKGVEDSYRFDLSIK